MECISLDKPDLTHTLNFSFCRQAFIQVDRKDLFLKEEIMII